LETLKRAIKAGIADAIQSAVQAYKRW